MYSSELSSIHAAHLLSICRAFLCSPVMFYDRLAYIFMYTSFTGAHDTFMHERGSHTQASRRSHFKVILNPQSNFPPPVVRTSTFFWHVAASVVCVLGCFLVYEHLELSPSPLLQTPAATKNKDLKVQMKTSPTSLTQSSLWHAHRQETDRH